MDAAILTAFGDTPSVQTVDDPVVGPNEVVVDVEYCSLNNRDRVIYRGEYNGVSLPYVLGSDIAGRVADVGAEVETVTPGDRVVRYPVTGCGSCRHCRAGEMSTCPSFSVLDDGLAERVLVVQDRLVTVPDDVSLKAAACLPVAYLTAWRMLQSRGVLRGGESVLVLGGSGGVGVAAIQLASALGAEVIAVSSTQEYCARLADLGADHTVNRTVSEFPKRTREITDGRGVDLTVDHVGEATVPDSISATANGGRVVLCGRTTGQFPEVDLHELFHRQLDLRGSTLGTQNEFRTLVSFIDQQSIVPPIDRTLSLCDVSAGFKALREGDVFGKVVITP